MINKRSILFSILFIFSATISAAETWLKLDSDADDYIGKGINTTFTEQTDNFTIAPNYGDYKKGVAVGYSDNTDNWNLTFAAPNQT